MTTVAIDFGTSNTIISILEADTKTPKTLRFSQLSRLFKTGNKSEGIFVIPSLVFVKESPQILLGETVRSQRLGLAQPQRLFKAFKRDLTTDFQPPPRQIDGEYYSSESISELFIKEILKQLQAQHINPSQVIFTVPVGAFERYLDWFRDLGKRLELPDLRLIDESTAAALGYATKRPGSIVLVIDFGGGTLDLSLVRTKTISTVNSEDKILKAEVLAKSDAYIGGEDIDTWIVEDYLRSQKLTREGIGQIGWQNLLEIAEKLKIRLSQEEVAKESWLDEESFMSYELQLSRDKLEEILEQQQLLEQLRNSLDEVLAIALGKGISKNEIEQVLLVGGTSLIPAIQQLIISYFGRQKVKLDKPFEAVCHGALAIAQVAEIEDYLHHSYAIRLWEPQSKRYFYFSLFDKGSNYPCRREETLTLQVATQGQKEIRLDIGEVAEISQAEVMFDDRGRMTSSQLLHQQTYRSLENHHQQVCVAHLDPPGELGIDRISVAFEVDEKRILLVTVRDLLTGSVLVEKGAIAKLK
jgi:molecular chaperone DnaK (HSP70)